MTLWRLLAVGVVVVVGLILGSIAFQLSLAGGVADLIPAEVAAVMLVFGLVAGRARGQRWLVPATWAGPAALLSLASPAVPGPVGIVFALIGIGLVMLMVLSSGAARRWSHFVEGLAQGPHGK
jgi:hypothetical protein